MESTLRRPDEQITTALEMFNAAQKEIKGIRHTHMHTHARMHARTSIQTSSKIM